jgi:hypothetical protein
LKLAVIALILLPACAQAQVYKCVASDGSTTYATVPCPEGSGQTTRIIEPVPPSGVLNIPATAPAAVDEAQSSDDDDAKVPTATGITVIEDSDAAGREQKREQMRADAEQHKKDMYDEDLRRRENREKQAEVQRKLHP